MNAVSFLSLFGAFIALFLSARLLLVPTENRPAAQALSGFLFCAALFVADAVCYAENAFGFVPWFYALANPFILALGPVFYLYTRAATEPSFGWSIRKLLHFLPSTILVLFDHSIYLLPAAEKANMAATELNEDYWQAKLLIGTYLLGYIGSACWTLWRRRQRIAEEQEEGRSHPVRGILPLATLVLGFLLFSTVADFTPWAKSGHNIVAFAAVLAVFSLLWTFTQPTVLVVPITAARSPMPSCRLPNEPALMPSPITESMKPDGPEPSAPPPSAPPQPPPDQAPTAPPPEPLVAPNSTAKDRRLPDAEVARIDSRIRALLEKDHIHLDPTLSLQVLAERAKTSRHNLSYVLKESFGASFYQLVSGYRVKTAAHTLQRADASGRTIADIAFASGFNTLSAFNSAFRAQFGITPSVFRERAKADPKKLEATVRS